MKNKERYAKEIMDIACSGNSIAVTKECGRIAPCCDTFCVECLFGGGNCKEKVKEWAEQEYIEKPKISKRDRAFLDYIDKKFNYITRIYTGDIRLFVVEPRKCQMTWSSGYLNSILDSLNINLPMVRWEDDKPWLIEDLKKLEVVEEYD